MLGLLLQNQGLDVQIYEKQIVMSTVLAAVH